MVEFGIEPVVGGVAVLAGGREPPGNVVRVVGRLKLGQMAGGARRRHDLKLAVCPAFVAGVAIDGSVGARQRESVVMLLHVLHRNLPSSNRVALLAVGSQLALVDVGVAVLATFTDIREDHLYVTGSTSHRRVHAPQGITGLIMVEFWYRPNWPPAVRGMTILAG